MRKALLLLVIILSNPFFHAQNLDVHWSEKFKLTNKEDGFFHSFVGANEQYVYAKFNNLSFKRKKRNSKIKLIAFDKKTMKKMADAKIKGYNKDNSDLIYENTFVFNKAVYVIWTKISKKKKEYFAQAFDEKLKKLYKLTKIFEVSWEKNNKEVSTILANTHASRLVILKELLINKDDDNLRIEYKMLNADLSFGSTHQVTLPIKFSKNRRGLWSYQNDQLKLQYTLADDANLYVQDWVKMPEGDKEGLKKGESSIYTYFAQINAESGKIKDYRVKYNSKNTFRVNALLDKGKIKLFGFFSDLNKDVRGTDTHGIFYVCLNATTFKEEVAHFEYFDKKLLDELYANDKRDQKKGRGIFKSKKAKLSDAESISDFYEIEQSISDGNNLTLFCSMMWNYSVERCTNGASGVRVCKTEYYCVKKNVTVFKMNNQGKFLWAKNIDREITYNEWNVFDLRTIKDKNYYYVLYGSKKDIDGARKRGSKAIKNEKIEYAIFSAIDGTYKKNEYVLNEKGTKKRDKKFVILKDIVNFDNMLYLNCTRIKKKPAIYLSLLFPPLFLILNTNGNMYKGSSFEGNMQSVKG